MTVVPAHGGAPSHEEPAAYTINAEQRRIHLRSTGAVDLDGLVRLWRAASEDARFAPFFDVLWDWRDVHTLSLDPEEIVRLGREIRRVWGGGGRLALVTAGKSVYGREAEQVVAVLRPLEALVFRHVVDAQAYLWRPSIGRMQAA